MRSHRTTRTATRTVTALMFLFTALAGSGSPLLGRLLGPPAAFPSPGDVTAAARRSGYLGVVGLRPGALTPGQMVQAALRRDRLTAAERARLDRLLAAAPPAAQEYLAEAFAAGHPVSEVAAFAAVISPHGPRWLRNRLRPIDPSETGPVQFRGTSISQFDDTTCGSTTIVALRALTDPIYALHLTTGDRPGTD